MTPSTHATEPPGLPGLTSQEARARLEKHGPNELAEAPRPPLWRKLLAQFRQLVVLVLLVAAVLAGILGDWVDTVAILAIVLLNGGLGFIQEERAERALAALRKLSAPVARAIRDGVIQPVPARELVPGDHLELEPGDRVPADGRLLEAHSLRVDESTLTGESHPVTKETRAHSTAETPLAERRDRVHAGTVVTAGHARVEVTATGMATELGRIAGLLDREPAEPTPLQRRLEDLGRLLVVLCLSIVGVILVLELVRGRGLLETLLGAASLAVAAVPEGLPAVVTIALTLGLRRLARRNMLVRRLPSVETLGSVTVICSDKTGTLTRNEMTVRRLLAGGREYELTGSGYSVKGQILAAATGESGSQEEPAGAARTPRLALRIGATCNNAALRPRSAGSDLFDVTGDPMEGALLVAARKVGIEGLEPGYVRVHEIPFDSDRKIMSVVLKNGDGHHELHAKGAPEVIVELCDREIVGDGTAPLTRERKRQILETSNHLASRALRVLAVAYREGKELAGEATPEKELTFVGLLGLMDPPRDETREAVRRCRQAGIRPVMITGDHPATALAIAREIELAGASEEVLRGSELEALPEGELAARVQNVAVYARVTAEHKLRIVKALKAGGHVVAMTGDGVNDAPAVKAADIGISMGIAGTDVTREASDMVLTDDNFASIVNAVEEGRGVFDNIQKFVHFLLACNASEVLLMLVAALLGWPVPLLPIQILWINLVTDGLPALALGMEPPERGAMFRPPRPREEKIVGTARGWLLLAHGFLIAGASAFGFLLLETSALGGLDRARTAAFSITALAQLFYSFGCRSHVSTLPQLGALTNPTLLWAITLSVALQVCTVAVPFLRPIFGTAALAPGEWGVVFALALMPVTVVEVTKLAQAGRNVSSAGRT